MTNGIEPISAVALARHLKQHRNVTFHHQVGSHLAGRNPQGLTVRCPDPGSNHPVTTLVVKEIARTFGLNLHDFRIELGYGQDGKSTVTRTRAGRNKRQDTHQSIPDPIPASIERIKTTADAIYRSGPARRATLHRSREIQAIANRLDAWLNEVA